MLKVPEALKDEMDAKQSTEGGKIAVGIDLEFDLIDELMEVANTHNISKSGIIRGFLADGLNHIKTYGEVPDHTYGEKGHYTSMIEPSILEMVNLISDESDVSKSVVIRYCILLGLEKYKAMNKPKNDTTEKPKPKSNFDKFKDDKHVKPKSNFDKFMDKASTSMKASNPKKVTFTITFEG